jgi:tRNA A64-2'-O-ribosylphosphate transferase
VTAKFDKPLRPVFVTPESGLPVVLPGDCYPVILLTASSLEKNHERVGGYMYIQGAADDEESWSHGLTSFQFWENCSELLACGTEEELISRIEEIKGNILSGELKEECTEIRPSNVSLGTGLTSGSGCTIICGSKTLMSREEDGVISVNIPTKSNVVQVMVHQVLPKVVSFALNHEILANNPISIKAANTSPQTLDLSIAITLVLLSPCFNDDGTPPPPQGLIAGGVEDRRTHPMNKAIVRKRLTWITAARGQEAERFSRQFLKIVHTYLMSPNHSLPN